jgi:anti-anti-sigma regulatory factor
VRRPCNSSRLRISRQDRGARGTTLRLEGRIDAHHLRELAAAHAECADRQVVLDLSGVAYLAWDAARSLAALRRAGVALRGGSGFVRELLRTVEQSAS